VILWLVRGQGPRGFSSVAVLSDRAQMMSRQRRQRQRRQRETLLL